MAITQASDNALLQFIEEDALFVLREESLMVNLVTRFQDSTYMDRKVGVWAQATAQEVAETVDFANPTTESKSLLATFSPTEKMAQFLLTDIAVKNDPMVRTAAATELGGAIAEKRDVDLVNLFSGFSQSIGSAGAAMTIAKAAAAVAILRNAKVRGERYAVLHPYHWHDLWTALGQPAATYQFLGDQANKAMQDYYVMNWMSVMWFIDANIAVDGDDDATSAIFTRQALAYDERDGFSIRPERDESLRATEMNAHIGYAVGELRDEAGVGLIADATAPDGS